MTQPSPPEPSTARLESFSDGVFAVAATLLVLDLGLSGTGTLAQKLEHDWPYFATYVVSFLTIGIIWMNHHAQFERIAVADRTLTVLNLFLLMFVTLIPFPTKLLANHLRGSEGSVAAAVYAGTMLAMSIAFFSTYLWAAHRRLFGAWIAERHVGYLLRRNVAGLLAYVVAIGVAFLNADVSLALCGLVALYYLHPGRRLDA